MAAGARVEIVEVDHEAGSMVIPTNVRVNGVDVGPLTRAPKIGATEEGRATDHRVRPLCLVPTLVEGSLPA